MSSRKAWLAGTFFLLCVSTSVTQDSKALEGILADVANIQRVKDVTKILNLNDIFARKVFYTKDCEELYQLGHKESGLYVIRPEDSPKLVVQCYFHDCGGWTVIQRNSFNTEIAWNAKWTIYKYGFGNIESDHWLGNHYIYLLTKQKWNKMRIVLTDAGNNTKYAEYDSFLLDDEQHGYRLRLGAYQGEAGDSLSSDSLQNEHDNMQFSTEDGDHDRSSDRNCADLHGGGWWFDSCYDAQLNRQNGIHWATLCNHNCRNSLMLIKPIHMYCHRV
ncbi:fibrinogen-like protein 1-like protein [Microcaecilia unicolor]|uniref:Fibrinogen-like protein 1-like protein n=1 Tax=Microcaecilia unicolor TaxID=1415580 RepID=A0A6P7YTZ2_9AMPH|nr:fibrinogen-like protein 1-like protein [Microcaecilia unicolor]